MTTVARGVRQDRPVADTAVARTSLFAPTRDRALILAWIAAVTFAAVEVHTALVVRWGLDSNTYWTVWAHAKVYGGTPGTNGVYLYSPAFAQAIYPLTLLSWVGFSLVWLTAGAAAYAWLVAPLGWAWGVPLFAVALEDIRIGNSVWLLALAAVLGFRWAGAWAVPVLMKLTPGIGLVWFAVRREWRALAVAAAVTLAVVALSAAFAPALWAEWFGFLGRHGDPTAAARTVMAAALVAYAGRTSRPWLIPVALLLAAPVLMLYAFGILCAVPRLLPPETVARLREPFGGFRATVRRALDLP